MIGGTMYINEYNFAEWQAINEGPCAGNDDKTVYACTVDYRNNRGYPLHYEFDVLHTPGDGALVLTCLILEEANRRING